MKRHRFGLLMLIVFASTTLAFAGAPTTLNDFTLPGSQPTQSGQLESPQKCDNCHGGYNSAVEPAFNWRGSMMAHAARDPFFFACMAISNQDAPDAGDLCIRCHSPAGWLEGRSIPTDGSALNNNDRESVQCDFCHKLVKPTPLGVNPYPTDADYTAGTYSQDQAYLATLADIPPAAGNGMYVADASNAKRGPFLDAAARHKMFYSPFHKDAALCGTCHDVSNPAFSKNPDGTYSPNSFDAPPPDFDPQTMFPVERTYSEWTASAYNTAIGVFAPQFGGNKTYVSTCQDCHMRDVTGYGCNKAGAPLREDLPLHDMTGGNTFIPSLVAQMFPAEVDPAALAAGVARATSMLQRAATLELTVTPDAGGYRAQVRVTNETGHKLPSGYPEGRRIWINIQAYDLGGVLVYESGAYDPDSGVLEHDAAAKIYHIEPGISADLAPVLGLPAGPSFHFVLNNQVYLDNRIPPRGFTNAAFEAINSPVVGYAYADGQYWDDTEYLLPATTVTVVATLYYQTTSKEYVEFLRDENHTNNAGQQLYDLWAANGRSAPVVMNQQTVSFAPPVADFSGAPTTGFAPLSVSFTDLSANNPTSWSWDFGDGGTSAEQNPLHTYAAAGVYTVSMTATNAFGSNTRTMTDYITVETVTQPLLHVDAISVTRTLSGKSNWQGEASVKIVDHDGLPIAGAVVSGVFNSPSTKVKTGTTDASGVAVITSDRTRNPPADWCIEVTDVALAGAIYDPVENVVTIACESGPAAKLASVRPEAAVLLESFPNPFNPQTEVSYYLTEAGTVALDVYNVAGRHVATLVQGHQEAGHHAITWNAGDLSSGVYLIRLSAGSETVVQKVTYLK